VGDLPDGHSRKMMAALIYGALVTYLMGETLIIIKGACVPAVVHFNLIGRSERFGPLIRSQPHPYKSIQFLPFPPVAATNQRPLHAPLHLVGSLINRGKLKSSRKCTELIDVHSAGFVRNCGRLVEAEGNGSA